MWRRTEGAMVEPSKFVVRALPVLVVAFLAVLVAQEIGKWDRNLDYIGDRSVDSGVGWFPLIWFVVSLTPFLIASLLCARFGRPAKSYWAAVVSIFLALSIAGFYFDARAWHQICEGCVYMVPGL